MKYNVLAVLFSRLKTSRLNLSSFGLFIGLISTAVFVSANYFFPVLTMENSFGQTSQNLDNIQDSETVSETANPSDAFFPKVSDNVLWTKPTSIPTHISAPDVVFLVNPALKNDHSSLFNTDEFLSDFYSDSSTEKTEFFDLSNSICPSDTSWTDFFKGAKVIEVKQIETALEMFRKIRSAEKNWTKNLPTEQTATQAKGQSKTDKKPVSIFICIDGSAISVLYLEKPIILTSEFSGTPESPTVLTSVCRSDSVQKTNFSSESSNNKHSVASLNNPITISGSVRLNSWEYWSEFPKNHPELADVCSALNQRISVDVQDTILVCNLKTAGIQNFGDAVTLGQRPELFFGGTRQQLAQFPDQGMIQSGKALGKTPVTTSWAGNGTKEGIFEFDPESASDQNQLNRWAKEPDVRLHGYWFWDWSEDFGKIKSIDSDAKTIQMQEPYHTYGYHHNFRYRAVNLLCELSKETEWYLDRESGLLFWRPFWSSKKDGLKALNSSDSSPSEQAYFSVFNAPFMLEIQNASNILVSGLNFKETRDSGIKIQNSTDCYLNSVQIENVGQKGAEIQEGKHCGLNACQILNVGAYGIFLKGGDRKTLTPGNHFVQNSIVDGFSRLKPTYTPAVYAAGCGHRIGNCDFSHSGSSAMRLEGNDLLIEYNNIHDVVSESDDQGGIDSWFNPSYRGIIIRYNYWENIVGGTKCGAAGIRLDDMISGVCIYGNIFVNCGAVNFGAVQIHGGKDNTIQNNIMFCCPIGVSFSRWGEKRYLTQLDSDAIKQKIYRDVDINSEIYRARYPELKDIRKNADINTIKDNLWIGVDKIFYNDGEIQQLSGNSSVELTESEKNEKSQELLKKYVDPSFLRSKGLSAIPWQKFGPKK